MVVVADLIEDNDVQIKFKDLEAEKYILDRATNKNACSIIDDALKTSEDFNGYHLDE